MIVRYRGAEPGYTIVEKTASCFAGLRPGVPSEHLILFSPLQSEDEFVYLLSCRNCIDESKVQPASAETGGLAAAPRAGVTCCWLPDVLARRTYRPGRIFSSDLARMGCE